MNHVVRKFTRRDMVLLGGILLGLMWLYFDVLISLVDDWTSNDNYSHGFFIPLISGYMVYSFRDELQKLDVRPANWGILLLILGLGQFLMATTGSEFFLQRTSIIPVLIGLVLFLLGLSFTRKVFLPIAYLIFMIPLPAIIWNKIAFPMQLLSSALTERVVKIVGIPVYREGNILHLAQTTLEVVDACSGLRSLTTMFALSAALAWFANYSTVKKWFLFFMAAPIAIVANIIRLTGTAILASHYGGDVAQGFLHEFSGMVTFFIGLGFLAGLSVFLGRTSRAGAR